MKTLDIVFTKSKKSLAIGSLIIRWWTGKPYSHCALQQEIKDWGKRYFQASEGKCNYEYETYFLKKHTIIRSYTIEISEDLNNAIKNKCYIEAGNTYATLQNLGIALLDIYFKIFHKNLKNPWTRGRNCSEILLSVVFKQMFGDLKYDENTIKPAAIEELILLKFKQGLDGIYRPL